VSVGRTASRKKTPSGRERKTTGEPASFFVPDHLVQIVPLVTGSARYSRSLGLRDEIVLHVPVRGYLRYLPAIYQGEGPVTYKGRQSATTALQQWAGVLPDEEGFDSSVEMDSLRRFLFIYQHMMTTLTEKIDAIVDLTDPLMCEPRFLPWLASWVSFELDGALPIHQQRELVRRAIRLYRTRGTREGIGEMVRVLTSAPVRVLERTMPAPAALGKALIIGGRDIVERYDREEVPGCYLMEPTERANTSFFILKLEPLGRFRDRFGERAAHVLRRIVHVVSQERPVHVAFTIQFDVRG